MVAVGLIALGPAFRAEVTSFYGGLFGWAEIESLRLPDRITLAAGSRAYVHIRERAAPMVWRPSPARRRCTMSDEPAALYHRIRVVREVGRMELRAANVELTGRVGVVTGGGSGVGRAIAEALSAAGATVALVGRTATTLEAAAADIGDRAHCYPIDVTVGVDDLVRQLLQDHGSIDVLVHSAGVHSMGAVEAAPIDDLDAQYRTNVRAPYALTQALLPALRRSHGQVVFVNSSAGLTARGGVAAYASTKHALRALADSLRDEVNDAGVRVLSVYLGRTASPMQAAIHAAEGKDYRPADLLQPADVAAMVVAALRLPMTAEVTELSIRPMRK
jgi:NADP-dependent 3-hydroxy acid dehydrogenase YdfG